MKNKIILVPFFLILFLTCSCSQSNVKTMISLDSYKETYSENIINTISYRTTENGVIGYDSTAFDPYTTFYSLKILELLGEKFNTDQATVNWLENYIYDFIGESFNNCDMHTLDKLWYMINDYSLILSKENIHFPKLLSEKICSYLTNYIDNVNYSSIAQIYRISSIQNTLKTNLLDINKTYDFIINSIAEINESNVIDIAYPLLKIAKNNNIKIDNEILKEILKTAETKLQTLLSSNALFPDLYQIFELICFLDENYNFDADFFIKSVSNYQHTTGLYYISESENINLLPTYWGIQVLMKFNVEIEKKDTIILQIKKGQMLNGLYNPIDFNIPSTEDTYAATCINYILDKKECYFHLNINFDEMPLRTFYEYCFLFCDNTNSNTKNAISYACLKINNVITGYNKPNLYNLYILTSSLEKLQYSMDEKQQTAVLNFIEKKDNNSYTSNKEYEFLYFLLKESIKSSIDKNYYISEQGIKKVFTFLSSEYKNTLTNDTLFCLYLCMASLKNEPESILKYKDNFIKILSLLNNDDGSFSLGVENKLANYESTFMGLEILNHFAKIGN